jgi:pimeloyl-ACP methyl ester carboxylesterase
MTAREPQFITVGESEKGRKIAYLAEPARDSSGAGILWLIGLKSDMASTKAGALADWAAERDLGFTRFDYSGHGLSEGPFELATISDWLEEASVVFRQVTTGPQIIAGSSTGGHVALLLLRHLMEHYPEEAKRVIGLVLIAPAWDLTEELMWKAFPEEAQREIVEKGAWVRPSAYDARGYPITRIFIEDGRKHLLLDQHFNPGRPVAVLQGAQDQDVPLAHAERLASVLDGGWVSMTVVPDGEHRLSRPEDLELLYGLIETQLKSRA